MRNTLAAARASRIPNVLNLCAEDARVADYLNEAVERLLPRGHWVGTYQKYAVCVCSSCLTWPRQISAIETMAICNQPIKLRNEWFEFLEEGYGLRSSGSCGSAMFDRGTACAFEDMNRSGSEKIKVFCDAIETTGARILLQGYDENHIWIRTQDNGVWIDGEYVSLNAATPQVTTKFYSRLVSVIKPITNKSVRLYRFDPVTGFHRALAIYEWDEEFPNYRRSFVPGMPNGDGDCAKTQVTVMAKMQFIPVRNDNDWLLIGNLPALKDMCMSIKRREDGLLAESVAYELSAISELESELSGFLGSGAVQPVNFESHLTWGGAVANVL